MSTYNFRDIEKKWQQRWKETKAYKVENHSDKPKYYVLDMFPYPSGAGLHVGHPLGYIASDIVSRYKRLKGFNVLHPMGFDSFGLPAEQYAIQTGQHPAVTTKQNIDRYKEQLEGLGFSFDWDREVQTSDPAYYKWTQWIFCQLFESWYNKTTDKAEPISKLVDIFSKEGNSAVNAHGDETPIFTAAEWNAKTEEEQQQTLLNYRMAYLADSMVNWCPELGTVLANEEVKDGVSERGGYPVFRVNMRQWFLRITAYADRLLNDLETIDWTDALKEQQRNWIGRSEGASIFFGVKGCEDAIEVFSTRPDTIFGATFMVLAPEHELVEKITTSDQKEAVEKYIEYAKNRSERDRMSEVKTITGCFTGAYAENPFTGQPIPIWIAEYVLAGYGTGAVMAVPGHDSRDYAFAKHFGLPIVQVVTDKENTVSIEHESFDAKDGILINSGFLNGMDVKSAIKTIIKKLEEMGIGKGKVNYRLRDAGFSRQRYWGEPFPVVYRNGLPYLVDEKYLPVRLPQVTSYKPTGDGESPLAGITTWVNNEEGSEGYMPEYEGYTRETNTMPGWAGSSWYYLRYMDPHNNSEFASKEAIDYWQNVDLYIGGSEHATGHLLYVRFWTKFLYDIGKIPVTEPAKKLINQGMIQGVSQHLYLINVTGDDWQSDEHHLLFISKDKVLNESGVYIDLPQFPVQKYSAKKYLYNGHLSWKIDISFIDNNKLYLKDFLKLSSTPRFQLDIKKDFNPETDVYWEVDEKGEKFIYTEPEVEKMSKSKWNVVNPDDMVEKYGADTLRLYEMFLGPLEQSKPWNTNGIEGVFRFLGKFWRQFYNDKGEFEISDNPATPEELKILHKTIKKTADDIEAFSFNTTVSAFMICVNELGQLKCNKRSILEPLLVCLSPYAPHIAEELWQKCGHSDSILKAQFPVYNPEYLVENSFSYPVSINGKTRLNLEFPLDMDAKEIEAAVLSDETVQKWVEGKPLKKFVFVKGRIINVVV